tara:strand:+ start:159 stop:311 length:153 start_codon:yes stop_codon:yes gene_type:complete
MNKKQIEQFMDEHNVDDGMYLEVWNMVNMKTHRERRAAFVWWLKINLGVE